MLYIKTEHNMMRYCGWVLSIILLPLSSFTLAPMAGSRSAAPGANTIFTPVANAGAGAADFLHPRFFTTSGTSGLDYKVMSAPENMVVAGGSELYRVKLDPGSVDPDKIFLLIDKSDYRMYLYEDVTLRKIYKVTFGNNDQSDKMIQGDRRTPEGVFHISNKRMDARWSRFMLLDYPNETSWTRFHNRQAQGIIPSNANIGDGVGIHGVEEASGIDDQYVEKRINWTLGCISLKSADIAELYSVLKVGTPVVIRP